MWVERKSIGNCIGKGIVNINQVRVYGLHLIISEYYYYFDMNTNWTVEKENK